MGYCSMTYFLQWNPDQATTTYPLLSCIPTKKLNLQTCSSLWTFFSVKGWHEEYDPAYPGHNNLRESKNIRCDESCSTSSILEISCRLYIALEENLTSWPRKVVENIEWSYILLLQDLSFILYFVHNLSCLVITSAFNSNFRETFRICTLSIVLLYCKS